MNVIPIGVEIPIQFFITFEGSGVTGQTPSIIINKTSDNTYFTGSGFSGTVVQLPMTEVDSVNQPGLYTYTFDQSIDNTEQNYNLYFSNTGTYAGNTVDSILYSNTGAQLLNALIVAQAVASKILVNPSILIDSSNIAQQDTLLEVKALVEDIDNNMALQSTLLAFQSATAISLANITSLLSTISGSNQVTIHVEDQNSDPIPDVLITFKNTTSQITLAAGRTDSNGDLTLGLPSGTFNLLFFKAFVSFPTMPYPITVTTNETFTIEAVTFAPTAPSPNTCAAYAYIIDASGQPIQDVMVRAKLVTNYPYSAGSSTLGTKDYIQAFSDASGFVQLNLIRGAQYEISSPALFYTLTNFVCPDVDSLDLSQQLDKTS